MDMCIRLEPFNRSEGVAFAFPSMARNPNPGNLGPFNMHACARASGGFCLLVWVVFGVVDVPHASFAPTPSISRLKAFTPRITTHRPSANWQNFPVHLTGVVSPLRTIRIKTHVSSALSTAVVAHIVYAQNVHPPLPKPQPYDFHYDEHGNYQTETDCVRF